MATPANFKSKKSVRGRLQAALYFMRKKNRKKRQEATPPPPE